MSNVRHKQTKKQHQTDATHQQMNAKSANAVPPLEELQSAIGNQALGRLLDAQNLESSSVSPLLSSPPANKQRAFATPEVMQGKFQFKGISHEISSETAPIQLKSSNQGNTLPTAIRNKMEESFKTDFTDVRIHQGPEAKSIGALAFTQGNNIYFQPESYNPQSISGQTLLGHELTHVVQQRAGRVSSQSQLGGLSMNTDSALEAEADRLGARAAHGKGAEVDGAGLGIQQQAAVVQQNKQETTVAEKSAKKEHKEETKNTTAGAGYITTTDSLNQRSAEAEAAAKKIVEATDAEVKLAVEALAKAGVFGEASGKAAVKRGPLSASVEGSAKGSVSAEATAKASASVKDIMQGLTLLAEASAKAGAESDLEGRLALAAGPLQAQLLAKLHVAASVLAEAKGKFNIGLAKGLVAEGSAKASAMVEASGEVSASIEAYSMEADLKAEGEAKAGAEASAEGKVVISLQEITASGKAEFFAGAKAKGSVGGSLTYKGKVLAKLSVEAEASAGVGGEVKGEFSYKNGTVKLSGKLAATLGVGSGVETSVEANPKEILKATGYVVKDAVKDVISTRSKKKKLDRKEPQGERPSIPPKEKDDITKQLREAVFYDFEAYGLKKSVQGDNGIKQKTLQKILDENIRLHKKLRKYILYKESDEILENTAKDAFGSQLAIIKIKAGNITEFKEGTKKRVYSTLNKLVTTNAKH